jgi:hypothetical protein
MFHSNPAAATGEPNIMKNLVLATVFALALSTPALAGNTSNSTSNSSSSSSSSSSAGAVAISRGGAGGAGGSSNVSINDKYQAPGIGAPGLAASGSCLGSASGGVAGPGFGVSFGSTTPDLDCRRRETARLLGAMYGRKGALAGMYLLAKDVETYDAMVQAGMIAPAARAPVAYGSVSRTAYRTNASGCAILARDGSGRCLD